MPFRPLQIVVTLTLLFAALGTAAHGQVYVSREEALKLAFPGAEGVDTVNLYLTEEQKAQVARASGARVDSAIYSFYVGKKGGEIIGYAAIEAATVRTLPETVMVVMTPAGAVNFVEILAFFEPEEYKPPGRWLDQFRGKRLTPGLRVGGDIQGMTGATLSAQAIALQVRKTSTMLGLLLEQSR